MNAPPLCPLAHVNGDHVIASLDSRLERVETALVDVAESLKCLARVDAQHEHTRAMVETSNNRQDRFDERLRQIELEIPGLKELRGWAITGLIGAAGMLGASLLQLAMRG